MKKRFARILTVITVVLLAFVGANAESVGWNVNGSKTASQTALTSTNDTSTITLSLPAGEALRKVDVVFVMDASSSTSVVGESFVDSAIGMLNDITQKNIIANVGVIKCRGVAIDCLYETTGSNGMIAVANGDTDALNVVKNAINFDAKSKLKAGYKSSGTNLHAGLVLADKWLTADSNVANDDKYVIFLTDGKTYIWDDNGTPTTIYAQAYNHYEISDGGEIVINQNYGRDKGVYSVGPEDMVVSFNTAESGSGAEVEELRYNNFMRLYNSTNQNLQQRLNTIQNVCMLMVLQIQALLVVLLLAHTLLAMLLM